MTDNNKVRVEIKPITDALPDPNNANKHTQRGAGLLDKSLRSRGFFRPIAAAGKGVDKPIIRAGNLTQETAINAGMDEAIFIYTDGTRPIIHVRNDIAPDSKEADQLALEDNRVAQVSLDWDIDALSTVDADVLKDLWTVDELDALGIIEKPQGDAEPQIDRAAELQEKWQVKTGDLWRIGDHRLLCGDSTKREDVERVMDIDCSMVADPPYNVGLDYGQSTDDEMTADEYWKWQHKWFDLIAEGTKRQVITPGCVNLEKWVYEFSPHHIGVWDKGEGANTYGRVTKYWAWEPIMCHGKFERKRHTDVFRYSALGRNPGHPCPKPIELWCDIIDSFTDEAIIDPFVGSGTTIVACQNLGRKCRAIEISPEYCAVTLERMAQAFPGIEIERITAN